MKHVIIGTAGHVDHGKTTLIQALTGTNTDRLKEEQERGMTIDIGFAALRLPDGTIAGIVDVPGHERFLKNMLAGITGVDVVLLVVAADESVMPQTVEHLDILRLLDVQNGVVALTKMDLVDKEWTDAVEEDIQARLAGTPLAHAPIIRVSSTTGKGIDALKRSLLSAVSRAEARNASLPFRLPIDRVFIRPGFGTVVTGTLVGGTIRIGDAAEIVPQLLTARVRGLQVHGKKVAEAEAGSRVAVNLASIEQEQIERGAQLTVPGAIVPTTTFDASVRLLADISNPVKDRARVRVHVGTAEILGRVRLLDDRNSLGGGDKAYIQFRGETQFACARGDRFVLRSYSPMHTIGGGVILDAAPARHARRDADVAATLAARERGTPEDMVETLLLRSPFGMFQRDLSSGAGVAVPEIEAALHQLTSDKRAVLLPQDRAIHSSALAALSTRVRNTLAAYHEQFPLRHGMPKEELRTVLGRQVEPKTFASLLAYWNELGMTAQEGATVRLSAFRIEMSDRQEALMRRIEQVFMTHGIATPTIEEVCRAVSAPPDAVNALLKVGVDRNRFVRVADGLYYDSMTLNNLKEIIRSYVAANGSITVGALRDLTHSNRKFALTALEYFDRVHFTRRQGDDRVLIEP
jgi:selenocysteine-specific elongation factor